MGDHLVDLREVDVSFGRVPVLASVSLRLTPGQVLGVAGPNGAGKTTLLALIATLIQPSAGAGTVMGARLGTGEVREIRRKIGWSGHEAGLYPELTLSENIRLWADIAGKSTTDADELLDLVGLASAAGRRASDSSNGMQRRVDLARILLAEPELVLLDEAHAGLDEQAEAIVDEIIARTRTRGGGALLVSHDAVRLGTRVDSVRKLEAGSIVG